MSLVLALAAQTVVEGPPPQDPGLVPYVPAVAFLILAPVVWWIWHHLAED
jgi:hypothetical protein